MEMSLKPIADLLLEKGVSDTAFQSTTPFKQQALFVTLESERSIYRLELYQDGDAKYWRISETEASMSSAMSELSVKEFPLMKCPAASSYDQLNLWHSESNK